MIPISNEDARIIQLLLERGNAFYRNHAVRISHINDGRRMAVMARKLKKKVNRAAASPRPQINNNYDKKRTD